MPTAPAQAQMAILSFCKLCDVLDLLVQYVRPDDAGKLQTAIKEHLDMFQLAYGTEDWIPKFHLATHLPQMLLLHCILIACFVHERKHKALKKYANNLDNTSRAWEKSIMMDALYSQLESMCDEAALPKVPPCLCKPRHPSSNMRTVIQNTLELQPQTEILISTAALFAPGMTCSKNDVVVIDLGSEGYRVGEIWIHTAVVGEHLTLVSLWRQMGHNMFMKQDDATIVYTADIKAICVYKNIDPNLAFIIPPARFAQLQR